MVSRGISVPNILKRHPSADGGSERPSRGLGRGNWASLVTGGLAADTACGGDERARREQKAGLTIRSHPQSISWPEPSRRFGRVSVATASSGRGLPLAV
ncbi:MAG: hypothetical protein U0Q12_02805 [Vicinamibacterales bacterium]